MKKYLPVFLVMLILGLCGVWFFFSRSDSLQTENEIVIWGDDKCQKETHDALDYLKAKAPEYYKMVKQYIGGIDCVTSGSGIKPYERPAIFHAGDATREAGTEWYAGSIVHDSCHVSLYDSYAKAHPSTSIPLEVWSGREAEMKCIDIQEKALHETGAPEWVFKSLEDARTSQYWLDERWW